MKFFKNTHCCSIKMKAVEFEILYSSGVHSLRDKFCNDQLYQKCCLTEVFFVLFFDPWALGAPWGAQGPHRT